MFFLNRLIFNSPPYACRLSASIWLVFPLTRPKWQPTGSARSSRSTRTTRGWWRSMRGLRQTSSSGSGKGSDRMTVSIKYESGDVFFNDVISQENRAKKILWKIKITIELQLLIIFKKNLVRYLKLWANFMFIYFS